jgi:hypothetical protein
VSLTVCLGAHTLGYPEGGGHFWVYLNWALGLQASGCRVIWLEVPEGKGSAVRIAARAASLNARLGAFGLADSLALVGGIDGHLDLDAAAEADLFLNLRYGTGAEVVRRFRRSALVDIDPGLLQIWMHTGQLEVAPHDVYLTIGETVGTAAARFPDGGVRWQYIPPPVFLPEWPPARSEAGSPYTTVSGWWGRHWVTFDGQRYCNDKRESFMEYLDLPARSPVRLELALTLGPDADRERELIAGRGWSVRDAWDVAGTPEQYRAYIQKSRGEFSCAKPSCMRLANAWISDRTLCYLASGKPAVVQHTGPSGFLPDGEGLFRFRTPDEAAQALRAVESDYDRHAAVARALAEAHFDAGRVVGRVLERALS